MNKKISAFVTSLALLASSAAVMPAFSANAESALPDRVDLSTDEETADYFPEIGNQHEFNSCTAWATTYYQFSYEVKRALDIKDKAFAYSPAYTYNQINFGDDQGSNISNAYYLLKNHGALTFDQFGYDKFYRTNPNKTNTNEAINALNLRVKKFNEWYYNGFDYNVKNEINSIKTELNKGKAVVTSGVFSYYDTRNPNTLSRYEKYVEKSNDSSYSEKKEKAFIYNYSIPNQTSTFHTFTIVGYDDNIRCDINENGTTTDPGETGAFKIANSWGNDWCNGGFAWIMYDTLYSNSQAGFNTPYNTTRERAFSNGWYYTIDVEEKDVKLLSEVELFTNNSYAIDYNDNKYRFYPSYDLAKTNSLHNLSDLSKYPFVSNKSVFSGSLYNDLTEYGRKGEKNSIAYTFGNNQSYSIKLRNLDPIDTHFIVKAIRIKDNKGTVVSEWINGVTSDDFFNEYNNGGRCEEFNQTFDINLPKGDLNYDGNLDQDDFTKIDEYFNIINYRTSDDEKNKKINENFSSFQLELLDADDDGNINMTDYNKLIGSKNS